MPLQRFRVPVATRPRPYKILRHASSLMEEHGLQPLGPLSCSLISIINREQDDYQIRVPAHDLSQNRRVPRRVPACADIVSHREYRVWRGPCSFFRPCAKHVPACADDAATHESQSRPGLVAKHVGAGGGSNSNLGYRPA